MSREQAESLNRAAALMGKINGPTPPPTDADALAYIKVLYTMEANGDFTPSEIAIGPYSLFILISAVQLALRHPRYQAGHGGALAQQLREITDTLRIPFNGTPGDALITAGFDTEQDRE